MSLLRKMPRGSVLAGSLLFSVVLGSVLGHAYRSRVEAAPPAEFEEGEDDRIAEALGFDREPPPPPAPQPAVPEADAAHRAQLAQHLAQVERTGQAALRQRMPLPPKAGRLVSIGDRLDAHGVPMNLAAFETEMKEEEVLAFYARHFEQQGWPYTNVPSAKDLVPYLALSATVLEEELQLTVMVMPHGDGKGNTVVLGLADMEAFRKGMAEHDDTGDLPVYPGTDPLAVRAQDEGSAALTVSFDTTDAPRMVEDFYRKELAQRGYTETTGEQEPDLGDTGPKTLHFSSHQGRSWNLALSSQGKGTAVTAHGTQLSEATP
ncbi:MAG: hypothetical protein ACJ8AT_23000 [Hyalangium sp.]|uniref:hypothetical protein n=1 Tax=Hyalangium sp. TaxID=2028555 RepID=UPI00389ADDB4